MFSLAVAGVLAAYWPFPVSAQTLPTGPLVFGNGRVAVSGDASVSFAPADPGFFTYTDYEASTLRMFRGDLTASAKFGDHLTVLGDLRSQNGDSLQVHALYIRVRPWTTRAVDFQAGRIPPTFGAFGRQTYGIDNPLIGLPIAYQYVTSLRGDALPADTDELLSMRGRGARATYSIGSDELEHGYALASPSSWDSGVQMHIATPLVDATASVTTGSLSYPLLDDDNDRKRVAGRVIARPAAGLVLGVSASRGPFIRRAVVREAVGQGHEGKYTQTAWGGDVEYSRGHYIVRAETLVSDWTIPIGRGTGLDLPLRAWATSVEGRYRIRPGLYAAARFDRLGFSEITGTLGRSTWEAPVTRVEIGEGYSLQRNLVLKFSYQYSARDGGDVRTQGLVAGQLQFWF
jgi:hypothetical protein